MSFIEQRSAFRINDTLVFKYKKLSEKESHIAIDAIESGNPNLEGKQVFPDIHPEQAPMTINISASGAALTTDKVFAKGDQLGISLYLSVADPIIRIVGNVASFEEDPEGGTGYIRIEFTHITQHDKLRITNYTSSYIEQQRRQKSG